jgi:hypothetical protein
MGGFATGKIQRLYQIDLVWNFLMMKWLKSGMDL